MIIMKEIHDENGEQLGVPQFEEQGLNEDPITARFIIVGIGIIMVSCIMCAFAGYGLYKFVYWATS